MAEQTLKEKTAKGLFWGGISNGVQQVLGVLIGIVLLRNLSPGDYGMVGMLAIFTGIASTIQESGFTAALTNRPEFKAEDYNAVFWFNVFVGSGIYVILFFCAPLIAKFYNQPDLVLLSRVLFLSIVIGALGIAHNAVLFRKLMVKERAKIDIISIALAGIVGIYLAVNGYGYWALAIQTLVFSSFGTILRWIFSPWHPTLTFNFTPVKEMFGFGIIMLLSSFVSQVQVNVFSVLLGRFYSKVDVGYYSQGTKWGGMGSQVLNGMVVSVAQPVFVETSIDKYKQVVVFRKMIRFIALVSFPIMLGIAFISRNFIELINTEWLPCVPVLQMYCIWGAVSPILVLYNQIIISYSKSNIYFMCNLIFAIVQIGLAFLVLSKGLYWIAFTNIVAFFLFLLVWHVYVSRIIPVRLIDIIRDTIFYFILAVLDFILTYYLLLLLKVENQFLLIICKIVISSCVYILVLWKAKSIIFRECLLYVKNRICASKLFV